MFKTAIQENGYMLDVPHNQEGIVKKRRSYSIAFFIISITLFISCSPKEKRISSETSTHLHAVDFELRLGIIHISVVFDDTIKSDNFILDNGCEISQFSDIFWQKNFDTSKFTLIKKGWDKDYYSCSIPYHIGHHKFVLEKVHIKHTHMFYGESLHPDGIIGVDPFLSKKVCIDFKNKQLFFKNELRMDTQEFHKTPLTAVGYKRFIRVQQFPDGKHTSLSGLFLFDLGCNFEIVAKASFFQKVRKELLIDTLYIADNYPIKVYQVDSIYVGSLFVKKSSIAISGIELDPLATLKGGEGIVGSALWKNYFLCMDYASNQIFIKK